MDINELITYLVAPVGQIALIMAIAEGVKKLELFATKFIFIFDILLGIALGVGTYTFYLDNSLYVGIIGGLACGCVAAGVFSGVKNLRETYDNPEFVDEDESDE